MAGLATHRSAEPETLVVRVSFDERELLVEDAPETYYLTDYYRSYSVVLVRLSRIDQDALRDLLSVSWRLTLAKTRTRSRRHGESTTIKGANRRTESSCARTLRRRPIPLFRP
jgi:hypothetical protein